mgnify:CR=1 FL=1
MGYMVKVAFYIYASHEEVIYMALATFFDFNTGEITGTITCSESAFWPNVGDRDWIAGIFDAAEYYVDAATYRPVPRPAMEGITVEGNIVSGLPVPCTVDCNGGTYEIDDGVFEYDTPLIGTYHFRVRSFPLRDFDGELTVTPPQPESEAPPAEDGAAAAEDGEEPPETTTDPGEEASADEDPAPTE